MTFWNEISIETIKYLIETLKWNFNENIRCLIETLNEALKIPNLKISIETFQVQILKIFLNLKFFLLCKIKKF